MTATKPTKAAIWDLIETRAKAQAFPHETTDAAIERYLDTTDEGSRLYSEYNRAPAGAPPAPTTRTFTERERKVDDAWKTIEREALRSRQDNEDVNTCIERFLETPRGAELYRRYVEVAP